MRERFKEVSPIRLDVFTGWYPGPVSARADRIRARSQNGGMAFATDIGRDVARSSRVRAVVRPRVIGVHDARQKGRSGRSIPDNEARDGARTSDSGRNVDDWHR